MQDHLNNFKNYKKLVLDEEQIKDVKNIAHQVYWPLTGFLKADDFNRVVSEMRLENGVVWPIPIVLDISRQELENIRTERQALLVDANDKPIALLKHPQVYSYDKDFFSSNVFGTLDQNHPGVHEVYNMKEYLIGGDIELIDKDREPFPEYNYTPVQTRQLFKQRGWKTVVAFQTRNVPHSGHEFLQKQALKEADGLFIQPVIGRKKIGDFRDEYILISYEILINKHYPKDRVFLGILPLKMRYAGPREAIFHALIRKNFGCTHFIVGRDHAGVGDFYGSFDAQNIFEKFRPGEIDINILKYPEVVYYPEKDKHIFKGEAPEHKTESFSGTKLRACIEQKELPPEHIIRPEVFGCLSQGDNALVDQEYKNKASQPGFVLWFTGFSQSGKSTIADQTAQILKNRGLKIERLDGDIVRQTISKDLGFSKQDRDENIRRIGLVSSILSHSNTGVITSFISPYQAERDKVRQKSKNFIEVFCNCPLETCEARDNKGLYAKARAGEIANFTGISDPYEQPINPEIELNTGDHGIDQCVDQVIDYLEQNGFIK